jgi:hypothetical protein
MLGHGGGRSSGTWVKGQPRPPGIKSGRKKGSKNRIPRTLKQSIDQICQELVDTEPGLLRRAFRRGINARPPASYAYLQLIAAYTVGRPAERLEIKGTLDLQVSAAGQHLKTKLQQMAEALARAREREAEEAARRALPWGTVVETSIDSPATS